VAGRKTEAQFEQQFKSFNDMVTSIGKAYVAVGKTADQAQADVAALLAAERQGPAATQAWVDALQGTLDRAATLSSEASSRFGPSKTDLQKLAKDASDVYQYMLKQGTFTADQLAAAFKASQEAQAKSLGINTEATQKNLDALNKGLEDLTSKRDSLWQQVSQEAPEEVMGVIETAQRTQLGVLDDQIAAQKLAIEKEAADAADALKRALEGIEPDPIHIPYTWVPTNDFPHAPDLPPVFPQAAGGDYIVTRPTLFLAGEAGAERATFTPHGGSSSGDIAALSAAIARLPRTISRSIRDALVGMNG
jgi:plasmid stabilization system protein ParE